MGAHGYDGHLEILDSGDWLPQRRHRAYFAFSQRSLLQAKQVFQVASCIRSQCHNLQACPTHPAARRAVKKTCSKRCQREGRWVGKTAAFIREKQLDPEVIRPRGHSSVWHWIAEVCRFPLPHKTRTSLTGYAVCVFASMQEAPCFQLAWERR